MFFFLVVTLQVVAGYSPLAAGLAPLPVTVLMLLLSPRAGALSTIMGPKIPMTVGPLVCAVGAVMLAGIGPDSPYLTHVLPGIVVFGLGLSATVAPLTTTALAAAPDHLAGVASGVNNAVARVAGLLAIAVLPLVAGVGLLAHRPRLAGAGQPRRDARLRGPARGRRGDLAAHRAVERGGGPARRRG